MNAAAIPAVVVASVAVLTLLGGVLAMTFRMGRLSGQIASFIVMSERDRNEILVRLGAMDERWNNHLARHDDRDRS